MISKSNASLVLFLALNLAFFALVSGCGTCGSPTPKPTPPTPPTPTLPAPTPPTPTLPVPTPPTPTLPAPTPPTPTLPTPNPNPSPSPSNPTSCPIDTLRLGVCADLLGGLLGVQVGSPPVTPCCTLIQGLANTEAAVCLCTAIRANVLGINLNVPVSLSLLLNACGKNVPSGFQCA